MPRPPRISSPLSTKRGTSPTTSSSHGPLTIVVCIGACFLCTSVGLYWKLEGVHHHHNNNKGGVLEDDVIAGGGDGRVRPLLRQPSQSQSQSQTTNHRPKRRHVIPGVDPDTDEGHQIYKFEQYMRHEAKIRRTEGRFNPREQFEAQHLSPESPTHDHDIRQRVEPLRQSPPPDAPPDLPYDIYQCPDEPPADYPFTWNSVHDVLSHWNPDTVQVPHDYIHNSLCVFDWDVPHDRHRAETYRQRAVPFVVHHHPDVWETTARWTSSEDYLQQLVGDEPIRNEHSLNNHFMYWKSRPGGLNPPGFIPPTDMMEQSFADWYRRAKELQDQIDHHDNNTNDGTNTFDQTKHEHWYFRLNAMYEHQHPYLYDELPFFDPSFGKSFTVVQPELHRGINCRFGMAGVLAEAHFDGHNNFIALLGGQRRYILAHPNQCDQMELYESSHPSGRHSKVNWSTAAQEFQQDSTSTRPFAQAQVNEVVLQAGDLMYLPPFWFHFIVSLNINYQCNSRSGDGEAADYAQDIADCGFANGVQQARKAGRTKKKNVQ